MRTLLASALVLLACGCADRSSRPSGADAPPSIPSGPDAVVLRIPRNGGAVVAYAYPGLDSVLWRSSQRASGIARVLAFGPEDGYLAAVDSAGSPMRIDLRLGTVLRMRGARVSQAASFDGGAIYVIDSAGSLTRFTPSGGDWKATPPLPAATLLPQPDGSLIVAGVREGRLLVWRIRPPNDVLSDSMSIEFGGGDNVAATVAATAGTVGDRVYIGGDERVVAIGARDLRAALDVDVGDPVEALAFTPSGDRAFVSLSGKPVLRVVDRFEEGVTGRVRLPGVAHGMRMDPLGRVVLVHGGGDTAWVVSVAEGEVTGTLQSEWRSDLPMVLADGRIATARGEDVVIVDPVTLADERTIAKGARDLWHQIRWNGFRPRAAGLDEPVEFRNSAPRQVPDSVVQGGDSGTVAPPTTPPPTPRPTPPAPPRPARNTETMFTVSFAALLNERQARDQARRIEVDGVRARVVTSDRDGHTIYRVILGPYTSRAEAERVGKASGQNFWVYEGAP